VRRCPPFKPGRRADDGLRMRGALALVFLFCALPPAAATEVYRCPQPDGRERFAGDASACPGAQPHELEQEIQIGEPGSSPPASRGEIAPIPFPPSLEELFPPARAAGTNGVWEILSEASVDASQDSDFARWGVREKHVRHYTHREAGFVRVCTVELWSFESDERARIAEMLFSYPDWIFRRAGSLLVMLHAVSRQRRERASREIFPECSRLGARIVTRAKTGFPAAR